MSNRRCIWILITQNNIASRKLGVEIPITENSSTSDAPPLRRDNATAMPSGTPSATAAPRDTSSNTALWRKVVATNSRAGRLYLCQ